MKEIQLSKGYTALVDDSDYDYLNQWKWYCSSKGYAVRNISQDGKIVTIRMHCIIMGGKGIDHIDGNKLNNQRANLRYATHSQNMSNTKLPVHNRSGVKGLSQITRNKYKYWLGHIQHAGKKYVKISKDRAVVEAWLIEKRNELHGEFARF